MDLKDFQKRVVTEVEAYLSAIARERAAGNLRHAAMDAWKNLGLGYYQERQNGIGEDLPTFTIKVPTGGGKTLLATQILGSAYRTTHKDRNGAGLVLWVVPSSQIYRDTLRRLADRNDMYRLMLEHAVSRRIELWNKGDIRRLTPAKLRDCLNIMVVQLASTNRETKDQLRFFKDSGGNIVDHFPPENDPAAQGALKQKLPNLDMIEDDAGRNRHLCATSVANLVKLCRPIVILDEGHKATSALARQTIEGFNASLVVELSATPKAVKIDGIERRPNIVSRVTGKELYDEEMIKLPMNIYTSAASQWEDLLTKARDKRETLAKKSAKLSQGDASPKMIRPMVLVQVERTGKDQRGPDYIHSEDVREFLTQRLGVSATAVRVKSAEDDGLEDVNLDDPDCPVTWIITKSALQEGWDCPQAYILASLNNTGSLSAMTQLVGRIMRQPDQRRTPDSELNESYVFVLRARAGEVVGQVKKVLEEEGYEGEVTGMVVDASAGANRPERKVHMRRDFSNLYTRPFAGKIYLPHFCVKEGKTHEPLDYYRHLISQVDVTQFGFKRIDWNLNDDLTHAKDRITRVGLGEDAWRSVDMDVDLIEADPQILAWMTATLPFEHLSHKQLRHVVKGVYERLMETHLSETLRDRLTTVKFVVRQKIADFIEEQIDIQTEAAFKRIFDQRRLHFFLECKECNFEIPAEWTQSVTGPLHRDNGDGLERSLFDYVDQSGFNELEKAIALCLDQDANVLWWYRNLIGPEHFAVQGFRKQRIRPDFVVQGTPNRPLHRVIVIESKGDQLEGNADTTYKRKVAKYYEEVGHQVSWQQLGADFKDHMFRFRILDQSGEHGRNYLDDLRELLGSKT